MSEIVGIDLGTTNSLVAKIIDGKPVVLRGPDGKSLVPSVICFPKQGPPLVGSEAKARSLTDPLHTVFSVKRLMGRTLAELRGELGFIPQRISERDAGRAAKFFVWTLTEYSTHPRNSPPSSSKKSNRERAIQPGP